MRDKMFSKSDLLLGLKRPPNTPPKLAIETVKQDTNSRLSQKLSERCEPGGKLKDECQNTAGTQ